MPIADYPDGSFIYRCLSEGGGGPESRRLDSGIIYPRRNDTVESVKSVRGLLLGKTTDRGVKVGDPPIWGNLSNAGVLFRNTRLWGCIWGHSRW